ncbi:MAG: hypothetical protein ACETWR_17375 [Anaerolineae bacterium]
MSEERERIRGFIEPGSEIAGGVAGAALGLIAGGPAGALAGAALGPAIASVIERTCLEIYDRASGHRQRVRGGAAAAYALVAIEERIRHGDSIRDDGFFDSTVARSSADEILEGVILKSRNENEEKKVRYYSNIFVTAAFDPRFTPAALNHALQIADQLTYRQLCLLRLFSRPQPITLRGSSYFPAVTKGSIGWETLAVLAESFDLCRADLIGCYPADDSKAVMFLSALHDLVPSQLFRTGFEDRLYYLMQLENIPQEDVEEVALYLK